jgi:hypothetical protein
MQRKWCFAMATILCLFVGTSQSWAQGYSHLGCRCSPAIGIQERRSLECLENSQDLDHGSMELVYLSGHPCLVVRTYYLGLTPAYPQEVLPPPGMPMENQYAVMRFRLIPVAGSPGQSRPQYPQATVAPAWTISPSPWPRLAPSCGRGQYPPVGISSSPVFSNVSERRLTITAGRSISGYTAPLAP